MLANVPRTLWCMFFAPPLASNPNKTPRTLETVLSAAIRSVRSDAHLRITHMVHGHIGVTEGHSIVRKLVVA